MKTQGCQTIKLAKFRITFKRSDSFWNAIRSLLRNRNYRSESYSRGYRVGPDMQTGEGGRGLFLDGVLIAHWADGSVRMYLNDRRWHSWRVAEAIGWVRQALEDNGVRTRDGSAVCWIHEDCRDQAQRGESELAATCLQTRLALRDGPYQLPYFERQVRDGLLRRCPS